MKISSDSNTIKKDNYPRENTAIVKIYFGQMMSQGGDEANVLNLFITNIFCNIRETVFPKVSSYSYFPFGFHCTLLD